MRGKQKQSQNYRPSKTKRSETFPGINSALIQIYKQPFQEDGQKREEKFVRFEEPIVRRSDPIKTAKCRKIRRNGLFLVRIKSFKKRAANTNKSRPHHPREDSRSQ